MKPMYCLCVAILAPILLAGCATTTHTPAAAPTSTLDAQPDATHTPAASPTSTSAPAGPIEVAVREIPLAGPVTGRQAEISGLAWHNETLIILPQYPDFQREGNGALFALEKKDLLAFLDGDEIGPLEPIAIPLIAPNLRQLVPNFEGFEAIAMRGDRVFMTIEARQSTGMQGFLVGGWFKNPDQPAAEIQLDTTTLTPIEPQSGVSNLSDETLLVTDEQLVTIYEANGAGINAEPVAHLFDLHLNAIGTIPFPTIEYRITDATTPDQRQNFWAINYFFPGDRWAATDHDPLVTKYGQGPSHRRLQAVERLVAFQVTPQGIILRDLPPIQLELIDEDARNWEGIVRLDARGFLLMTDKYPNTLLGFVPLPAGY